MSITKDQRKVARDYREYLDALLPSAVLLSDKIAITRACLQNEANLCLVSISNSLEQTASSLDQTNEKLEHLLLATQQIGG
jgi:hypothetical protein